MLCNIEGFAVHNQIKCSITNATTHVVYLELMTV